MPPRHRTTGLAAVDDDELVTRAQAGQTLAEQVLLERYRRIARAKRRSCFLVGGDGEDVEQEAMIGLHKAIRDYRPDGAASFRVFAELCTSRQVATAIKGATRLKHEALNRYVSLSGDRDDGHGGPPLEDLLGAPHAADPVDQVVTTEGAEELRCAMAQVLSPLEAEVLRLHVEGWTYHEMAQRLGRPVKAIDNGLQRARRKVRVRLGDDLATTRPPLAS